MILFNWKRHLLEIDDIIIKTMQLLQMKPKKDENKNFWKNCIELEMKLKWETCEAMY